MHMTNLEADLEAEAGLQVQFCNEVRWGRGLGYLRISKFSLRLVYSQACLFEYAVCLGGVPTIAQRL